MQLPFQSANKSITNSIFFLVVESTPGREAPAVGPVPGWHGAFATGQRRNLPSQRRHRTKSDGEECQDHRVAKLVGHKHDHRRRLHAGSGQRRGPRRHRQVDQGRAHVQRDPGQAQEDLQCR